MISFKISWVTSKQQSRYSTVKVNIDFNVYTFMQINLFNLHTYICKHWNLYISHKKIGCLSNKILFALSCRVWLSSFLSQFLTAISNERVCDYEKIFVENEKKLLCKTSAQKVVSSKAKQILLHRKQINTLCKKLCT